MRHVLVLLALCHVLGGVTSAQPPAPVGPPGGPPAVPPPTIRIFIDCPNGCDGTYLRSELTYVDHVVDREVADVHILITERGTGSGGTEHTVAFIGLRRFESLSDTWRYASQPGDTDDAERRGLLRVIKLGLVRYLGQTDVGRRLDVSYRPPDEADAARAGQSTDDPWNFWVFRLRGNNNTSGEESSTSLRLSGSFSATRVTEHWKSSVNLNVNYRRNRYTFEGDDEEEDEEYISISRDSSASVTLIKSIGAHWGIGGKVARASSTYTNHRQLLLASPSVEYNLFPYVETTRRQLTFRYSLGAYRASYRELTLYDKLEESLFNHAFAVNWDLRQPWGTLDVEVEASQYLPDSHKNRLSVEGDAEVRLFKGFSLDIGASASFIRDQVYLKAGSATPEEILLRQRQIATSYDYGFNVGFSYSFGSVYNNVVNSRLSGF